MVDWVEIAIVVALVGLECVFDAVVVAWAAGRRSKKALVGYLESDESKPLWDRQTEVIMAKLEPRIAEVEARIPSGDIHLDTASLVETVSNALVPRVVAEVDKVRAVIDGKIGFARKAVKALGEDVAENVGTEVAAAAGIHEGDPAAMLQAKLATLRLDDEWVKEHPIAAIGLDILRAQIAPGRGIDGTLTFGKGGVGYAPGLPGRRK